MDEQVHHNLYLHLYLFNQLNDLFYLYSEVAGLYPEARDLLVVDLSLIGWSEVAIFIKEQL